MSEITFLYAVGIFFSLAILWHNYSINKLEKKVKDLEMISRSYGDAFGQLLERVKKLEDKDNK